MAKRLELIEQLVQSATLGIMEAIEVIDILIKEKFINILKVVDIGSEWDKYGSIWSEHEILSYVNEDKKDNQSSMDDILSWGIFYQLKTGKIISWNY